jgi:hypothetical protein
MTEAVALLAVLGIGPFLVAGLALWAFAVWGPYL